MFYYESAKGSTRQREAEYRILYYLFAIILAMTPIVTFLKNRFIDPSVAVPRQAYKKVVVKSINLTKGSKIFSWKSHR